jgi:hypothetical protein
MRAQGKIGGPDPTGLDGRRLDVGDEEYTRIWRQYDERVAGAEEEARAGNREALGFGAGGQGLYEIGRRALGSKGGGMGGLIPTGLALYGTAWWNRAKAMDRELEARTQRDAALAKAGYPVPARPSLDEALAELGRRNMNF